MKKTLFLLVLVSALLSARAAAADFSLNSVQVDTQTNILTASLRTADPCVLYTVLFDGAGQELGISIHLQDTTFGLNAEVSVPDAFACDLVGIAFARAFLLEYDTLKPLCLQQVSLLHAGTKAADMRVIDGAVTISTDRPSLTDYMLLLYNNSLLPDLLKAPFWESPPTDGAGAPAAYPAYAEIRSVLDAMRMNLDSTDKGGRGSVFDQYASLEYRNQAAALIRNASAETAGILGVGHDASVSPDSPLTVDCAAWGMRTGTQYAFVAVARSVSGGLDVFRAAFPLVLKEPEPADPDNPEEPEPEDTFAPVITDIQLDLKNDSYADTEGGTHTLTSWSGTALLTFDELLYGRDGSEAAPRKLDRGSPEAADRDKAQFLSVEELVADRDASVSVLTNDALVNLETRRISLRFSHTEPGASITFLPALCDELGNVRVKGMTLTLEVAERRVLTHYDRDGLPVYETLQLPRLVCSPTYWYPTEAY